MLSEENAYPTRLLGVWVVCVADQQLLFAAAACRKRGVDDEVKAVGAACRICDGNVAQVHVRK